jgi:endoribonuclease Dicer
MFGLPVTTAPLKKVAMQPRSYQVELFRKARESNTIVYLETGTGKTMISILLMEDFLSRQAQAILFLAPTNALVQQQRESIESFLDAKVVDYAYDQSLSTKQTWEEEFRSHNVFVMTPQTLVNLLQHGYFQMSSIDLLIIDECHKSSGGQPVALLMKQYYHTAKKKPHIFGMTASPLYQGKISLEDAQKNLRLLQNVLDSQLIAVTDYTSVHDYVREAKVHFVQYVAFVQPESACQSRFSQYQSQLIQYLASMVRFNGNLQDPMLRSLIRAHIDTMSMKERTGIASLEKQIFGLAYVAGEYGALAAMITARKLFYVLYGRKRKSIELEDEWEKSDISGKVHALLRILSNYLEKGKQCIVFVDRRDCAESLCELLNFLNDEVHLDITAGFAIGKTGNLVDTLKEFREGRINVLVSTRVMAEGIDMYSLLK